MLRSLFCVLLALIASPSIAQVRSVASTSLSIANASFETPVISNFVSGPSGAAWSFTPGAGIGAAGSPWIGTMQVPAGRQILFLQGTGAATQSFNVATAGLYRVGLRAAQRPNDGPGRQTIRIRVDGVVRMVVVPADAFRTEYSAVLRLAAGTHTLEIGGTNPQGGDNSAIVDQVEIAVLRSWRSPSTWQGGAVPQNGAAVVVTAGSHLVLDGTITTGGITVQGTLGAWPGRDLALTASHVMATGPDALFELGHAAVPHDATATLTLAGRPTAPPIMQMGSKFLVAMNRGRVELHGRRQLRSWTKVVATDAGVTSLSTSAAVDWSAGDQVVITSNRLDPDEAEVHTLQSVTNNGRTVNLNAPLQYPRLGRRVVYTRPDGRAWAVDARSEIGLLTHNVKVQGDAWSETSGTGFGGHLMIMLDGVGNASHVEFYRMGQRGMLGRYPWHWHLLHTGGEGQSLRSCAIHRSYNRAIVVHGTWSTTVADNVAYDHIGHGVMLEDGSEKLNTFTGNLALLTRRPSAADALTPSDRDPYRTPQNASPSTYWITNPNNTFVGNVAAGSVGTGFWFAFPQRPTGASAGDPRFAAMRPYQEPLGRFDVNVAHSNFNGLDINDQLDANHAVRANGAWDNPGQKIFDGNTFFSNQSAIYIGIGNNQEQVVYRNSRMTDNRNALFFATRHIVDDSVIVAQQSGSPIDPSLGLRTMLVVYDGPSRLRDTHLVGFDAPNATLIDHVGASVKVPNHRFSGITFDHAGPPRIDGPTPLDFKQSAQIFGNFLFDVDGSLTGRAGGTVVPDHPFYAATPGGTRPANWRDYAVSEEKVGLVLLFTNPGALAVRRGGGSAAVAKLFPKAGIGIVTQLHLFTGPRYIYDVTVGAPAFAGSELLVALRDAAVIGEAVTIRWRGFGRLSGVSIPGAAQLSSEAAVRAASGNAFAVVGDDLVTRLVYSATRSAYPIRWSGGAPAPDTDSDGDSFFDRDELATGTDPIDPIDPGYGFETDDDFEGWVPNAHMSGFQVRNGTLSGTTSGNDAFMTRSGFSFDGSGIAAVRVLLRSSTPPPTTLELFWTHAGSGGFSSARRVVAATRPANGLQAVYLDVRGHGEWNGRTIRDLRIDFGGQSGVGVTVESIGLVPAGGLTVPTAFRFDVDGDFEGFSLNSGTYGFEVRGGRLRGTTTTRDPYVLRRGMRFEGGVVTSVRARVRTSRSAGNMQMFWTRAGDGAFPAQQVVTGTLQNLRSDQWVTFDASANSDWNGATISGLRFDLGTVTGVDFEVDEIQFLGDGATFNTNATGGCVNSSGGTATVAGTHPVAGTTLMLSSTDGPNSTSGAFLIGLRQTGGVDLGAIGAPGCVLQVGGVIVSPPVTTDAAGNSGTGLSIAASTPADLVFHVQPVFIDLGQNALNVVTGDYGTGVTGR